ncbi:hypothetical protein ABPG77_010979 [Micractinium sp. CCAP 211/92]
MDDDTGWRSQDVGWDSSRMVVTTTGTEGQTARKRRRRFKGGSCQVPFCSNPLELQYHKKYHVCREHFSAPCVALEGVNLRFCQKCGKFQRIDAFDAEKRTCRVALAQHNARRRKREKAADDAPHPETTAGGSTSGATGSGGTGSAGVATTAAAAGNGSRGDVCTAAAANGAARSDGANARGPGASGGTVVLPPRDAPGNQPPAAWETVPAPKRQLVAQHQQQGSVQTHRPGLSAHSPSPASRQAGQQEAPRQAPGQAAIAPGHTLAAAVPAEREAAARASVLPKDAGRWQSGATAARGAPDGTVPPVAQQPPETAHPAAHLQGSGSAGSSGMPLPAPALGQPAGWPAQQRVVAGHAPPASCGPSPASLPASDLLLATAGSSGSVELLPSEALTLLPAYRPGSAPRPALGPTPACAGPAAPRIEDHLFSMSSGGELPDSCFAAPGGLPYLQSPAGQLEAQLHQQQQYRGQAAQGAGHLGGSTAASTNLPPDFQAHPEGQPMLAVQQGQAGQPQSAPQRAAPVPTSRVTYASPAALHRISLKIFQCTPNQLAPGIREELESVLGVAPAVLESYIRPGCTHLTVDVLLPQQQAAPLAAACVDAAALLHALRVPALLGTAASCAAALQWSGQLAAAAAGEDAVTRLPATPPRLAVQPACIAMPPPGQPWPLVQLRLQAPLQAGWDLAQAAVLARQSGRHLAVTLWGTDSQGAEAALLAAQACTGAQPSGQPASPGERPRSGGSGGSSPRPASRLPGAFSGEEDVDSAFEEPCAGTASPARLPGGTGGQAAGLWVCPVGLLPGSCELEVELRGGAAPTAGAAGAAGTAPRALPLLSHPAPLLVLRDGRAAAEVQRLVSSCGLAGGEDVDKLLRDIGLAAAYLEQAQGGAGGSANRPHLPPAPVAAAAAAAAAFVQQHDMLAVESLLRRAHAAAAGAQASDRAGASGAAGTSGSGAACAGAASPRAAGSRSQSPAEASGAADGAAAAKQGHLATQAAGKLTIAEEGPSKPDLASCAAKLHGKRAARGGLDDRGLSCTAQRVQAMLRDMEVLTAGESPAGACAGRAASQPAGSVGGAGQGPSPQALLRLGAGQGPSPQALLRLGAGLAAFFFAVLLVRLLPVAG